MIPPRLQWCHQIVVTSVCWPKAPDGSPSACSNCTRMLGHERKRFVMKPDQFETCVKVARDFIYQSPPCPQGRKNKVLGIFGGEPLMSPYFPDYVDILTYHVKEPVHRGLWTSVFWPTYKGPYGLAKHHVARLLGFKEGEKQDVDRGYLNWNMHNGPGSLNQDRCEHHPVLLSISDVIKDETAKWILINKCWLNRDWSAAYSLDANNEPKFYFCEVASSFDRIMNLGTGLPVAPGIWDYDIHYSKDSLIPLGRYANQIKSTCTRCGQALPLPNGRRDLDNVDDVSQSNLMALQVTGSPMIERGDYYLANTTNYQKPRVPHYPGDYIKNGYHQGNRVNDR